MKFINYLQSITDVSIYPMISLLLFTGFFVLVSWWILRADHKLVDNMKNLPLENDCVK